MRRSISSALAIAASLVPAMALPAKAETMPKFYVYGEDDTPAEMRTCKVTHASAIATVQSELRSGGIVIQTDSKDPETVMDAYVNITAMPIPGATGSCTYNFELSYESYNEVPNPFTSSTEFTKLTYCNKGSLMVWDKASAQGSINSKLREYVGECLTKYKGRNSR
ncbi:MAG: hypothetical protein ACKOPM_00095 [Novosphingobium sp.]